MAGRTVVGTYQRPQPVFKYGNKKVMLNGLWFDSMKEAKRYTELSLLQKAGKITDLQTQVKYELIPAQKRNGKVVERAVHYIADFVYTEDGETVVEDVKSPATKTPVYTLKRKLMLWEYGIKIREV